MQRLNATSALVFLLSVAVGTGPASAQQIQFAAQRGPYYVGDPVMVQVVIKGVDPQVKLDCRLKGPAPAGLTIEGPRLQQSSRSFTQIINGRVSSSESVDYGFTFTVTTDKEGEYVVGPFEVSSNGSPQEVAGGKFRFEKLADDPDMQIAVTVPSRSIYVGQDVPVTIRWSYAGDIEAVRDVFAGLQIRSPLFDQFTFRDEPRRRGNTLSIATAQGVVEVNAEVEQTKLDGRDAISVTGTRTMIPDSPGQYKDIPVTCRTEKVTQWRSNIFGDRIPARSVPTLAAGTPVNLVVKPIPLRGRPASYAGAVGRGFSIDVAANRSVVRLGDPISLNITVRGDGNVARVSLPPLNENVGLSSDQFQVPDEEPTGTIDGNQKQFNVNVRVKDPSVDQIPALAFSWFDPYQEQFATAVSKPIALQVMETQVVSAADVISSSPDSVDEQQGAATASDSGTAASAAGMAFVGANLAITRDPARLISNGTRVASPKMITAGCYALATVLVVGSLLMRQRASRDQAALGKKKRLRHLQGRIDAAARLPAKEAAGEIARALRDLIAELDTQDRDEIDQLVARCDNIIYTTGSVADTDLSEIASAAKRLVGKAVQR